MVNSPAAKIKSISLHMSQRRKQHMVNKRKSSPSRLKYMVNNLEFLPHLTNHKIYVF